MKSKLCITKKQLMEECGVTSVNPVTGEFTKSITNRFGIHKELHCRASICIQYYKKNSPYIHYNCLQCSLWNFKTKKYIALPFHKLVYIWFKGDITDVERSVVDHIDTNPFNNLPSNLRLLTEAENRAHKKRYGRLCRGELDGKSISEIREYIDGKIKLNENCVKLFE